MKTDIFLQKANNLFVENRLLKFVVVVLATAVVANSFMVYRAVKYQRTVLIPPTMTGTIEFVGGKPTDSYIRDIGRRLASLAVTYSPMTARAQFDELLAYYAPEAYPAASATWYGLASRVEESAVSSVFYPQKIMVDTEKLEITGNYKQFAGDQLVESGPKTLIARYRIDDGRFYLLSLLEKRQEVHRAQEETSP